MFIQWLNDLKNYLFQQFLLIYQMENKLKEILGWLSDVVEFQSKINQNKLSRAEVKALLQMVDVKRKGYLQLNDVFQLAGKVSQMELFAIFKFLDTQRTGQIRLQQLEQSLGNSSLTSKNTTKEYIFPRFYTIIDTVKDKPHKVKQLKRKYALNSNQLKATFSYIVGLMGSKYLTVQQLTTVLKSQSMKYGNKWGIQYEDVIRQCFPDKNVTQLKFIQCFSNQTLKNKQEPEQEYLLQDIEAPSVYSSKKQQPMTRVSPITLNKSSYTQNQTNPSIIYKKNNNFMQPQTADTPSFRNNSSAIKFPEQYQSKSNYKRDFDQLQGNINEVLSNIQQRREKLRQDSLERKKLIDGVMNRKRQLCGMSSCQTSSPKQESRKWGAAEVSYPSSQSNGKPNLKHYLNKYQQQSSSYKQPYISTSPAVQQDRFRKFEVEQPYISQFSGNSGSEYSTNLSYLNRRKPSVQQKSQYQQYTSSSKYGDLPSTPLASAHPNLQVSQIMKKYSNFGTNQRGFKQDDDFTLKQLCKSKSGFIYSQPTAPYQRLSKDQSVQQFQTYDYKYNREIHNSSSKSNLVSKENVLKRAEEEANRKIEEIERKARMKVLQKKGVLNRTAKNEDYGKLIKRGCYY